MSIHNCLLNGHDDVEIFASHFLLRTSDPFEFGHLRVAGSLEGFPVSRMFGYEFILPKKTVAVGYTRKNIFVPTDSKHMAPIPSENSVENQC